MGFSRQEYWSDLPFPSPVDHILLNLSTMTLPSWVAPRAWLSFIELDKAVVLVWLDWLVFCEYGFSVFALWCPLASNLPSYLGFSYLGCGVSLHGCSSKAQPLLLTLDKGYLLTTALPDLQCGIAPLGPPAPAQPWLLGCGVQVFRFKVSSVLETIKSYWWSLVWLNCFQHRGDFKPKLP